MNWRNASIGIALGFAAAARAQMPPSEIRDAELKTLEKAHLAELREANTEIGRIHFAFPFSLDRYVGLSPKDQIGADTRGIEFVRFHGSPVLKVTGNYNAAFSGSLLTANQRASRLVEGVISPIVPVLSKTFAGAADFPRVGFEIGYHVLRKDAGFNLEGKEIIVLLLDRQDLQAWVNARGSEPQLQAILNRSETYVNGNRIGLALGTADPTPVPEDSASSRGDAGSVANLKPATSFRAPPPTTMALAKPLEAPVSNLKVPASPAPLSAPSPAPAAAAATPDVSAQRLDALQKSYQPLIDKMTSELGKQVQFISYAPPSFIAFHHGAYLQASLKAVMAAPGPSSQYRLAALTFDEHISHLIRPALQYFEGRSDFDGIDFSVTAQTSADGAAQASPLAVEFVMPLQAMRSYADFDTTGQQLIDSSYVLMNGERVKLDLQTAEAVPVAK